jgi:hypothetical protein
MTFKEALKQKQKNINLEYELRAARIANWVNEQESLTNAKVEKLYNALVEVLREDPDDMDAVAYELLEDIK